MWQARKVWMYDTVTHIHAVHCCVLSFCCWFFLWIQIIYNECYNKVCAVIWFLLPKSNIAEVIHSQLHKIYCANIMNVSRVRQLVTFKEVRTNIHYNKFSFWLSMVIDGLVEKWMHKIMKIYDKWSCSFKLHVLKFHNISDGIVTEKWNYKKLWTRWVHKMLTDIHEEQWWKQNKHFFSGWKMIERNFSLT